MIWRRKLFILVSTLLCAVAGFAISSSIPKTYTAKAMLAVKSLVSQSGRPDIKAVKTIEHLLKSNDLLKNTVARFNLDLSTEQLKTFVTIKIIRNSSVLKLQVNSNDPVLARDMADFMVNEAKELNDALTKETSERSKGLIKVELDIANRELDDTSKALLKSQSESDMTIKKGILQASQQRLQGLEIELSRNSMNITQTEAELAKAKELIRESEEKLLKANKLESILLSKAVTLSGALAKHETIQSEREKMLSQGRKLED